MGNRAMITTEDRKIGIYLHWNGGYDSVSAFLEYCKLKGCAPFESDYGMARFVQIVSNFLGGLNSIGIEVGVDDEDAMYYDNGIYVVKGWDIVERVYDGAEQKHYKLKEMLIGINKAQPKADQIDPRFFESKLTPVNEIKVGDWVYIRDWMTGTYEEFMVAGIGKDRFVNGTKVKDIPFVDKNIFAEDNINCYLTDKEYRVLGHA